METRLRLTTLSHDEGTLRHADGAPRQAERIPATYSGITPSVYPMLAIHAGIWMILAMTEDSYDLREASRRGQRGSDYVDAASPALEELGVRRKVAEELWERRKV